MLGIDIESSLIKEAKMKSLMASRQRIREILVSQNGNGAEDQQVMDRSVGLGNELAKARGVDFNRFSSDIVKDLRREVSATEVALIMGAYVAQAPLERMEMIPKNLMRVLDDLVVSETKLERFDEKIPEDEFALILLFESIRARLADVRNTDDENFRANVWTGVENALGNSPRLVKYGTGIVGDMAGSKRFYEKIRGWKLMGEVLDFDDNVRILEENLDTDPVTSSMFIEKQISILSKGLRATPADGDAETKLKNFLNRLYLHKREISKAGYWNIVLGAFSKQMDSGVWIETRFPNNFWREVQGYHEEKTKNIAEIKKRTSGPHLEELDSLGLGGLSDALGLMSESDRDAILEYLSPEDTDRDEVLKTIFEVTDSNDLDTDFLLTARGKIRAQAKNCLSDPRVEKLFAVMAREENRDRFAFELAVYSSLVPLKKLSGEMKRSLGAFHTDSEQGLRVVNGDWYLCSMSEHRMLIDILAKDAILVNDCILLKLSSGKKAGLCIKTFTDPSGDVFLEGVWYALSDRDAKRKLNQAFRGGAVVVEDLPVKWTVMRSVTNDKEYETVSGRSLMAISRGYAEWCRGQGTKRGVVDRSGVSPDNEAY